MFHHARGRQLDRAAGRQLAHGNVGAAMLLHGAAVNQHIQGVHHHHHGHGLLHHGMHHGLHHHHHHGFHSILWNPWYHRNWLVRRAVRREMIRRSCVVPVAAGVPLHTTVVVVNPQQQQQLMVLPAGATFTQCAQHQLQDLPDLIEVVFDQQGKKTTLYADRKCIKCGQIFFCYSNDSPPPYTLPDMPVAVPPPASPSPQPYPPSNSNQPPYPAASPAPHPTSSSPAPYPAASPAPYPGATPPYPGTTAPYPGAAPPYPGPSSPAPYPGTSSPAPYPATSTPPPFAPDNSNNPPKICLKCTQGSQPNAVFCGYCGTKFPTYCGGCGQIAADNAKFCGYCGKGL